MTIAALKCPACGANVECFDSGAAEGWCPYCGSKIVDIAAQQARYAVSAGHEDLLRTAREHLEMGNRASSARYARRYIDVCPASFDGYLALMDALGLPSTEDLYGWDRAMPELTRACARLCACAKDEAQRMLAEERRQGLIAGIREELAYVTDALDRARFLHDKASKDTVEADSRASKLYTEYLEFDTGELECGDGCDYGMAGAINGFLRELRNDQVRARMNRKQELLETWQSANAEYEKLKSERTFFAEEADDYEKRVRNCKRHLKAIGDSNEA